VSQEVSAGSMSVYYGFVAQLLTFAIPMISMSCSIPLPYAAIVSASATLLHGIALLLVGYAVPTLSLGRRLGAGRIFFRSIALAVPFIVVSLAVAMIQQLLHVSPVCLYELKSTLATSLLVMLLASALVSNILAVCYSHMCTVNQEFRTMLYLTTLCTYVATVLLSLS